MLFSPWSAFVPEISKINAECNIIKADKRAWRFQVMYWNTGMWNHWQNVIPLNISDSDSEDNEQQQQQEQCPNKGFWQYQGCLLLQEEDICVLCDESTSNSCTLAKPKKVCKASTAQCSKRTQTEVCTAWTRTAWNAYRIANIEHGDRQWTEQRFNHNTRQWTVQNNSIHEVISARATEAVSEERHRCALSPNDNPLLLILGSKDPFLLWGTKK